VVGRAVRGGVRGCLKEGAVGREGRGVTRGGVRQKGLGTVNGSRWKMLWANVAQVVGRRPICDLWCGHGYEYVESGSAAAGA
jgi:hypothetical protein